jgi:uncharacterized protein
MSSDPQDILIIKLNPQRQETWRYQGRILSQDADSLLIEAFFNRDDLLFHGVILRENDRFIERYYTNRWYNIFEIHDRDDDRLKAWYCNVTTPAEIEPGRISYVDLALDLLVYPDGSYLVLDEDEFAELDLDPQHRLNARQALTALVDLAEAGRMGQEMDYPA